MLSKRIATNAGSVARCTRRPIPRVPANARLRTQNQRFQSTSAPKPNDSSLSAAAVGGVAGSLATFTIGYIWYRQSGAKELLNATKKTKDYVNTASKKLKDSTPEPNEALDWLHQTARTYVVFIPGARGYIDAAFDDLDAIREKHGQEVDDIVKDAYTELQGIAKNGDVSLLTAEKAWNVLVKHLGRIGDLAGDASQQILDNHPALKQKVGGNIDKLKQMADNYGPDVKQEVDRTWQQIRDIASTGMSAENIEKVRKVVQEKVDKLKELGDEAWEKGMQEACPYLDRNPQVKKLVEENADALKQGNVQDLFQKVKQAVESGSTGDLESYVKSAASKAKESGFGGFGLEQYLEKVPGGDQVLPKLSQLQEAAEKHGDEAQKLLKEAVAEISDVLRRKGKQAEELARKAKDESKK
ncbi:hypothetical protein DM02DRAFT_617725 [Periconia macrospinosa]|uniref:Uncharacterized protein n=1 Tax=Periconia macrospinosa TaxID=97972 RepID=A0A2V1DC94_9PLEO|nr:hypothetical protein DM02DRAFT_617725 [Periconia macrospinosa]